MPKHQEQFQTQYSTTITASGNIRGYETFVEVGTWRTHKDRNNFVLGYTRDSRGKIMSYSRKDVANTLHSSSGSGGNTSQFVNGIRRLTPIECERLQGFPDNWTKYGVFDGKIKEISDTQRYKMIGNAVTVRVIEEIGKKIWQILD